MNKIISWFTHIWTPTRMAVAVLLALLVGFWIGHSNAPTPHPSASESAHDAVAHAAAQASADFWTCAMHTKVRLPAPGDCPICGMDLIPVHGGSVTEDDNAGPPRLTVTPAAKALMEIQTAAVERRFVPVEVRMVGKVRFDETQVKHITSWIPGRIDRMYVDFTGVEVKEGDHLVYLYSPELLAGQDELRRAYRAVNTLSPGAPAILRETAEKGLKAARVKLRRWGLTDKQITDAAEEAATTDHVTIYAPSGGTVIEKNGQEGMYVDEGTVVYTIADLTTVWVMLDAYESDLTWLHLGQTVDFGTEAYPGETFEGKIAFIDPVLSDETRTAKVRVNVPNKEGRLKPEMFVRAVVESQVATGGRVMDPGLAGKWISRMHPEIVKDEPGTCDICGMPLVRAEELGYVPASPLPEDQPLVIPASAPLLTGTRAVVYVVAPSEDGPVYEGREIRLGPRAGDYYIVRDGLVEGERVVTNGNFKIDSALQIQAKPSMMSPEGGASAEAAGSHSH